jgi:membrane protease YdiL (CAAX protease family)
MGRAGTAWSAEPGTDTGVTPEPLGRRQRIAAALALALWVVGAAAAVRIGFWWALGITAVALGLVSLAIDRSLWRLTGLPPWMGSRDRQRAPARLAALGVLVGVAMAGATYAMYPLVVRAVPWLASDTRRLYASFAALTLGQAALALPPILLGEELFWRGLLHQAFFARLPAPTAVFLGATAYALGNLPTGSPTLTLVAFACGAAWSTLRITTRTLLAPLTSHLVWNTLLLVIHPIP